MVDIAELINQDLEIANQLVEVKKFDPLNVVGNRILQNLFVLNKRKMMFIGLALKEISHDLQVVNSTSDKNSKNIKICQAFAKVAIENMKIISDNVDLVEIWHHYIDFENNVRKYLLDEEERAIYKEDTEFSTEATTFYLNLFKNEKSSLLERKIQPLERTRSELATLFNTHGGKQAIVTYSCIRALEHTYRFILHGKVRDEELEKFVSSNMDKIDEMISFIQKDDENELISRANAMIGDLMHDYRKYFFLFGELKGEFAEEIPISPEAAQKIRKIVEKNKKA